MADLVEYWRSAEFKSPPFVHPADRDVIRRRRPDSFAAVNFQPKGATDLHLGLLPEPFVGDLRTADIFILTKNPGFNGREYEQERLSAVTERKRRSLMHHLLPGELGFYFLDPRFSDHPGYAYWTSRLRGTAPFAQIANRIATLEAFPYHSKRGISDALTHETNSHLMARSWVHKLLVPRARRGEILLIVARQSASWQLSNELACENLIVYGAGETASAWLTPGSAGGRGIMRWLARHPSAERGERRIGAP